MQVRGFPHADDIASGFVAICEAAASGVFNISSGEGVSMREVFSRIESTMDRKGLIRFGARPSRAWEPPYMVGSNEKLKQLGWKPRYTLSEGLRQLVEEHAAM